MRLAAAAATSVPIVGRLAAQARWVRSHSTQDEPVLAAMARVVDPSSIDCLRNRRTPFPAHSATVLDESRPLAGLADKSCPRDTGHVLVTG